MDGRNVHGNQVTRKRVHRFLDSLRGVLGPTPTVNDVELLFLYLHKVELLDLRPLSLSSESPTPANEQSGRSTSVTASDFGNLDGNALILLRQWCF
ncbi:hypothetical protein V7S43_015458 [Phytophthora oleae]|uniref:Uncharacterized protein n=1 Tax=Phytophthora oleae TaxID=2107226 RepID=A0ABD3F0H0_9STRA